MLLNPWCVQDPGYLFSLLNMLLQDSSSLFENEVRVNSIWQVLGYLLETIPRESITIETLEALESLSARVFRIYGSIFFKHLLLDLGLASRISMNLVRYIIFNFRIWSTVAVPLQLKVIQIIASLTTDKPSVCQSCCHLTSL